MARCEWVLLCDNALYDLSGRPTLVGIFERINAPTFPAVHPILNIAMKFAGAPNERVTFFVRMLRPDRKPLFDAGGDGTLGVEGNAILAFPMVSVPVPTEGVYECQVSSGPNTPVEATVKLFVDKLETPLPPGLAPRLR